MAKKSDFNTSRSVKDLRNKIIDTLLKKGYNYEDIKNILEVKENNDE